MLTNFSVVIVGLIGWVVLGERPSTRTFAGLPLVLGGAVLISGCPRTGARTAPTRRSGWRSGWRRRCPMRATCSLIRRGNRDGRHPFGSLFDASVAAAATGLVAGLVVGDIDLVPTWPAHGWLFLVALTSQVAGYGLVNLSLPRLPAVADVDPAAAPTGDHGLLRGDRAGGDAVTAPVGGVALVLAGVVSPRRATSGRERGRQRRPRLGRRAGRL